MYPQIEEIMQIVADEGVKIVFTSAGSPKKWTDWLHERGITVVHVVSSSRFAVKAEEAGVDAIVAEGFEAGGHNGREETTTLCLIPAVRAVTTLPLIAAGGIATGEAMLAARVLGAEGVQIGTRFALTAESSANEVFKAVGASEEELRILLGRGRAKRGIFEGDLEEGELEIGQVSALLHGKGVQSVASVMQELVEESRRAWERMQELDF